MEDIDVGISEGATINREEIHDTSRTQPVARITLSGLLNAIVGGR
jgi:hypothetical protein